MMSGTWRTIVLGALVILVVLGAGWAVQRVTGGASSPGGAAVGEPAKAGDAVRPVGADQEYDRSDLLLIQG